MVGRVPHSGGLGGDARARLQRERPHLDSARQDAAQRHVSVLGERERCADGRQALLLYQLHHRRLCRQPAAAARTAEHAP